MWLERLAGWVDLLWRPVLRLLALLIETVGAHVLLLLNVINRPFRVGRDRGNDAISLMPLYEFIVHAKLAGTPVADTAAVIDVAEQLEVVVSQSIDPQEAHREVDRMMAERFGVPGPPQP